ncbi:Nramp family divalent metal transporter [Nonomuraea sp. NPDC050478]|jgi:Mn2+/Fe2+ NRAMP family transporter|uniref:Nramp family divalent metal transporter n=1 Tax=unclassified Nonomuraea TaxID=2593643 RepID=UPI0011CE9787|nr:Nramp family divalent metal transporter [Nonomuraea sp. C10]TXK40097.1 divalent metal cation transporter [Nonomuraea sp. C10]
MDTSREVRAAEEPRIPASTGAWLRTIGPGLVLAAAAVGSGDMITALVAGGQYGMGLLWAILLAVVLKFFMTEGIARWTLSSGTTLITAWQSLSRWVLVPFAAYVLVLAMVFGAAGPSAAGLAANAMVPGLSPTAWAIVHAVVAFIVVLVGRYRLFELVMKILVGMMFVCAVAVAVAIRPNVGNLLSGSIPSLPDGSLLYVVSIIGGFGGTLSIIAYGYWAREKGWRSPPWVRVMRVDVIISYVLAGIFAVAMLIVGAEFLTIAKFGIEGNADLVGVANLLGQSYGAPVEWLFLLGFWAVVASSVLGVWNGFGYLFADAVRAFRGVPEEESEQHTSTRSPAFRVFLVLITFPPMILAAVGQPVFLVILTGVLAAVFAPFLCATLLWLLNSRRIDAVYRNRPLSVSNLVLGGAILLFAVLGGQSLLSMFG